jgi:hypothetical protein
MGKHCCIGESAQSLEIPLADCPDMSERHIDRHASFSGRSFDTTDRDDLLAGGDELFGNEANVYDLVRRQNSVCEKL